MTYKFRYKSRLFYRSVTVVGHQYNKELDRMSLLLPDGGILEIAQWCCYDCKLGQDWVLALKKDMESKAGQPIAINRDLNAN